MAKFTFHLMIALTASLVTSVAFAELFSFQSSVPPNQKKSPPAPTVLSPADFKNRVNTLSQKTQQELIQQTQNNLKQPTGQTPVPPLPKTSDIKKRQAPSPDMTDTTTNPRTKNSSAAADTPPPASGEPIAAAPVAPATQPQSEVYTGFQGKSGTTTAPASQSDTKNGWNIHY